MPLTSKGRKILKNMTAEYGEKRGKSVFYASKNAGKITSVDSSGQEESGVGAESWVGGRKNSTGYSINDDDPMGTTIRSSGSMPSAYGATPPTMDAFVARISRNKATDRIRASLKDWKAAITGDCDCHRRSSKDARNFTLGRLRDAVRKGMKSYDAIKAALNDEHLGFAKLKGELAHRKGVSNPGALAAYIGRKKYGAAGMAKKSAAGR